MFKITDLFIIVLMFSFSSCLSSNNNEFSDCVTMDINPIKNTREILLHEIAHYFTPGENHNKVFKDCCQKLGIPNSTHFSKDFVMPPSKYKAICECGEIHHIYQVRKGMVLVCLKCNRTVKVEKIK